jgi:iron complex outermembrane recepter protein
VRGLISKLVFVLLCCLCLASPAFTQSSGTLQGTVTDPSGAVIPGVAITIVNTSTHAVRTVYSDSVGRFNASTLEPGPYEVTATATGFRPVTVGPVGVAVGQTASVDVSLTLLSASEEVQVTAKAVPASKYRADSVGAGPLGDRTILDLPFSLATIPGYLMENQQARGFSDVIKFLPSAQIEARGGIDVGRPQTRGFEGSVVQNSRMDGLNIVDTTAYPMEQFDRIEILSGLAGSMYGPAAPAGVFNFVLKRPTDAKTMTLGVTWESRGLPTARVDAGGRVGPNGFFGYRTIFLYGSGTSYVEDSNRRRELASGAFDFHLTKRTVVELNGSHYLFHQMGFPGSFTYGTGKSTMLPDAPDPTRVGYGQPFSGMDLETNTGSTRIRHEFNANWHLTAGVLHQAAKRTVDGLTNQFTSDAGAYSVKASQSYNNFVTTSNLFYLNGHVRTGHVGHDIVLGSNGYDWRNYGSKSAPSYSLGTATLDAPVVFTEPVWTGTGARYKSSDTWQQAIIVGDTVTLTPRWSVLLSGSMNWLNSRSFTANSSGGYTETSIYEKRGFSPIVSLMFKPTQSMSTYVTYANSLQQGDIAPTTGVNNPGEVLAPYRSEEWEAGYKVLVSGLELTTAVFRMHRPFAFTDPDDYVYKVEGDQVNKGVELMAKGKVTSDISVFGGVTWLDPRLEDTGKTATADKQVVGVPKFQANLMTEYQVPQLSGLSLDVTLHHSGRRAANDTNMAWVDRYSTLDCSARYTHQIGEATAVWRVAAYNLTDTHYWASIFPSSINGASGSYSSFIGAPRTIMATVQIGFAGRQTVAQ